MRKIALIPAFEPDTRTLELLEKLVQKKFFVVLVDDGSGKGYEEIFEKAKKFAYVISYDKNRGKGYALKTGLKYIKENFDEEYMVITMDSDGQHTVEDAIKLASYLEKYPDEIVLGKRLRTKDTPFKSRFGNELTRIIYKISTGVNIYHTQTGLRAYSKDLIDFMLNIEGSRYEYEMNVLLEAASSNIKMKEIEIETIYENNNKGSHFHPIRDSISIYKQIMKFSLSSLLSFLIDYILYNIILFTTSNINIANAVARVISATANYVINRTAVFKSKVNVPKSVLKYIVLATGILIINTAILNIFVSLGVNARIAKLIAEIILFLFSWIIQKRFVFKTESNTASEHGKE